MTIRTYRVWKSWDLHQMEVNRLEEDIDFFGKPEAIGWEHGKGWLTDRVPVGRFAPGYLVLQWA